jgi:parallel beta-helix repeat protein
MPLFSWLHQRMNNRPEMSRTSGRRPALRFRPQVEALEGRTVPSTLTVTTNLDSGAGSLRAEIAAANPGDTINFAPSLNGQTITLTSGDLAINKSLTIQGPGAGQLAINGGNTSNFIFQSNTFRVFEVDGATTNVTLSGLTITQGYAQSGTEPYYGGGIPNHGTLTVDSCILSNNRGGYGGGIDNEYGATLTVSGCTLSNNRADNFGGGIYNIGGTLTVINTTLSGNSVNDGQGGGEGGAVYSVGLGLSASMTGCNLSNNTAGFAGGGIYIVGTKITIKGCTLSGNSARVEGSAIYNGGTAKMLTISDTLFSHNSPTNQFPIVGPWTDKGGNTFA